MKVSMLRRIGAGVVVGGALLACSRSYAVDLIQTYAIDVSALAAELILKFTGVFTTVMLFAVMIWVVRTLIRKTKGALGKA